MEDIKASLRSEIVQQLAEISSEKRRQSELAINRNLREFVKDRKFSKITAYLPRLPGEIDFIPALSELGSECSVYFVSPQERSVTPDISLHQLDLTLPRLRLADVGKIDLVIVPGLAFDSQGGRLGRGGGFYDRLLLLDQFKDAVKAAICFQFQILKSVPVESHDVNVDVLITDEQTKLLGR